MNMWVNFYKGIQKQVVVSFNNDKVIIKVNVRFVWFGSHCLPNLTIYSFPEFDEKLNYHNLMEERIYPRHFFLSTSHLFSLNYDVLIIIIT